jgi:hypothetical protein
MTTSAVERVDKLIRLATDPAAAEQESRTTALIACRTIRENKLEVCDPDKLGEEYTRGWQDGYEEGVIDGKKLAKPAPSHAPPSRRIIRARFAGSCRGCGVCWEEGDRIAWSKVAGAVCLECHKGRKAA